MSRAGNAAATALLLSLLLVARGQASEKNASRESLSQYLLRVQDSSPVNPPTTSGSLWQDSGRLANLATDYKAAVVGDLVTIVVAQDVTAQNSGSVATDRSFKASSGVDAVAGNPSLSAVQQLFSPRSSATLQGKAQATSKSSLRTSLGGRVVALLPSGALVIEAQRQVTMNNERQTILLRGVVRAGDLTPDNTVLSDKISNLELEVKGKGVLSDGTRPPNAVIRVLLRILGF
ncbi:MAG TPA: flagellar basal body L-ring protein FlgH [Terriglobales bacterium]|nr:flagellar basal body L-ring protein FlgH [Terriglobales bacterium]